MIDIDHINLITAVVMRRKQETDMSRTITLMPRQQYLDLVEQYAESFRGQSHAEIRARYRVCSIAFSRAWSSDHMIAKKNTRWLKAHMDAMWDAAPIVLD